MSGYALAERQRQQAAAPLVRAARRRVVWPAGAAAGAVAVLCGVALALAPTGHAAPKARAARSAVAPSVAPSSVAPVAAPPAIRIPAVVGEAAPDGGPAAGPLDAGRFMAGSCVAYAPQAEDRRKTVFLDAGHGGPDPGALGVTQGGRALAEADLTLPTVLAIVPLMQARGYRVVVSRTGRSAVARPGPGDLTSGVYSSQGALKDSVARAVCANVARADVLVSIHFNGAGSPSDAGMLTFYDDIRPFSGQSRRLASLLQADVLSAMNGNGWGIPDDGVRSDQGAGAPALDPASAAYGRLAILGPAAPGYLDTPSAMPGAVVEPLFITDPFEASIAAGAQGQHAIAAGVAKAVDDFLGS